MPARAATARRIGLQVEDFFAAAFALAFVALSLVLRRPLRMPWMGGPIFASCALLLAYGMGTASYLASRRVGLAPPQSLRQAWLGASRAVRALAPFLLGILFFDGLRTLTPFASPQTMDALFVKADRVILGGNDIAVLVEKIGHPALTEVLISAYGIDLITVPVVVTFFHARGQHRQAHEVALALLTLHAIGIVGYFAVPVVGPYLFRAELFHQRFPGGGLPALRPGLALIDALRGTARDCFPSLYAGHVVVIGLLLWRHARRVFWGYLPFGAAVILSTLYLRVHYVVDLVAGVPVALVSVRIAVWPQDRWQGRLPLEEAAAPLRQRRSA